MVTSNQLPSKTPPRPTPSLSSSLMNNSTSSLAGSLTMTPNQTGGLTPQTPPPNVVPLNFPLSPPSPPGRRFAGGLNSSRRRSMQQQQQNHDQILQQYQYQQGRRQEHQQGEHNTQSQRVIPHSQQQERNTISQSGSSNNENSISANAIIPAPPGINNSHRRPQQELSRPDSNSSRTIGNPFATPGRGSSCGIAVAAAKTNNKRGRYVPHVVTISLDTEPYVETTTVHIAAGSSSRIDGNKQHFTQQQHGNSGRIRTTTVFETSTGDSASPHSTTVTSTTYNVPGRGTSLSPTSPHRRDRRPRLGQLLSACPLDGKKASAVTCVKFSPCTEFCLIGYGVREPHVETPASAAATVAARALDENVDGQSNDDLRPPLPPQHPPYHPVTAMYQVNKGGKMRHVSTMLSGDDDVNIARFHPDSGYGFVYGTKQGRIRILGPRPWNYYN